MSKRNENLDQSIEVILGYIKGEEIAEEDFEAACKEVPAGYIIHALYKEVVQLKEKIKFLEDFDESF